MMRGTPLMTETPLTDWENGLLDCFEDPSTCCYGFWCPTCLACTVSRRLGENNCLPLCDLFSGILSTVYKCPIVSPAVLSARVAMRHKYGIKGSLCNDILISCCCGWCAWCQMHRELKYLKPTPVIINVQPQVVSMQPVPVMMNTSDESRRGSVELLLVDAVDQKGPIQAPY